MADKSEAVRVEGIRPMLKELRAVDKALPKEVRAVNLSIAQDLAAKTARSFAGRPGSAPKTARSVKALADQRGAYIRIGGNAYPTAMGDEFGAVRYRQFPAWRGSGSGAGYSLYPTLRTERPRTEDRFLDAMTEILGRVFPQ